MPVIAEGLSEQISVSAMKTASGVQRQLTPLGIEAELGKQLKELRVQRNLDQATLVARAYISFCTLRNLESGRGSLLHTLIQVVRVLGDTVVSGRAGASFCS